MVLFSQVNVVRDILHGFCNSYVLQDLKNAKSIVDWIAWAEPQYDFNPMIDEWCKEAPKELDFDHEAGKFAVFPNNPVLLMSD